MLVCGFPVNRVVEIRGAISRARESGIPGALQATGIIHRQTLLTTIVKPRAMPVSASMKDAFEVRTLLATDIEKCAAALAPTYAGPPYNRDASIEDASSFLKRALGQEARGCLVAVAEPDIVGGLFASSLADDGASLNITELFVVSDGPK